MDSLRPREKKDCFTVRDARESFVTRKRGHVSLTQLNPMEAMLLEMKSRGCFPSPSATMASRCEAQDTQASFTLCPDSSTTHRELVERGGKAPPVAGEGAEKSKEKKSPVHGVMLLCKASVFVCICKTCEAVTFVLI
ncbi:hypothetical protein HPP92_023846 [Vanilla planifolia]|uniref:Uncharacterized protein n=1 Tax=Vanilla planifolia TaxID=51239 RepID=A0A835PNM9_VANPL|nr:hypothetical protein HPP92_023846 [Vanilla planifolia]